MTPEQQRGEALATANESRMRLSDLKNKIRRRDITFKDLAETKPELLAKKPLIDVLRMLPEVGDLKLVGVGKLALRDNVNLLVQFGQASTATLTWVMRNLGPAGQGWEIPSFGDPTSEEKMAALSDAIQLHRKTVTSPSTPSEAWAVAEETLWGAHDRIMKDAA